MSGAEDQTGRPPGGRGLKRSASGRAVAVVGGGLAGLAAAVAGCERGLHVELFERSRHLGGRAGSFRDPAAGGLVDHCQHVSMGCCTNLTDFCRRTGIADCFRRYGTPHFFGPEGTRHDFAPSRWLPAPLHLLPPLMRLGYLTIGERWAVVRAMGRLARAEVGDPQAEETIGSWLRRHGQSERSIQYFWSVILVGALSEPVDRISLSAARQVFVDGFLASRRAYELEVPQLPLGEIYGRRVAGWLSEHGVGIRSGTPVEQIDGDGRRATGVVLRDGTRREFDFVIVAVPWHRVGSLIPEGMRVALPALGNLQQIRPAPITAVHLWFDRPITPLPHAVLIGRLGQWVFNPGRRNAPAEAAEPWHYHQVVISASHELSGRRREDVVAGVRGDLEAIWPKARDARLLHWRLATQPAAVFSCGPGLERLRPAQQTPIENLVLAGDWTATGWPATMEGAVRSGYLAVEAVLKQLGESERVLAPDLPRGRLARSLFGLSDDTA